MTTPFPPGQTVTLNGMQMYYVLAGQGEPLVLLHGYTGSSKDWALFFDDLAKEYLLVIPDLRGHGRSTNPSKEYTHRQAASDLLKTLTNVYKSSRLASKEHLFSEGIRRWVRPHVRPSSSSI